VGFAYTPAALGQSGATFDCTTYTGADASVQVNACIADVISHGGGVADARKFSGNQTISQEISVGNSSQVGLQLLLPLGTWSISSALSDGTSCGILQYGGTSIVGPGLGGGGQTSRFIIRRASGSSVLATYCTRYAQTGTFSDYGYFYASGFLVYSPSGDAATTSGYGAIFAGAFDDSEWSQLEVADSIGNGGWIYGVCCGTAFNQMTANSSGGIPLSIGKSGTNTVDITLNQPSIDHPATGSPALLIDNQNTNGIAYNININGLYSEGTIPGGSTVPAIQIGHNVLGVNINGGDVNLETATVGTVPAIQVNNTSYGWLHVTNFSYVNSSVGIVNNVTSTTYNGVTGAGGGNIAWIGSYNSGPSFSGPTGSNLPTFDGHVVVGDAGATGRAACIKSDKSVGYCSTRPDGSGACTCN
jgi:hypothetical protein